MLRVGLTGGIAAGKSMASRRLAARGAVLIDADVIAREVVERGTPGFDAVVAEFGPAVVATDGSLNRPELGRIVFGDQQRRQALNAIVHPLVYQRRGELVDAAAEDAVVVEDVPLLVENGLGAGYHIVVVVHAPEDVRVQRLVTDRGMDLADATARIRAQATDDERRAAADVWLDNSGRPEDMTERVDSLWDSRLVPFEENLRHRRPARHDPFTRPDTVAYNPDWPRLAERLAARAQRAAGERIRHIEHVGPTARPGAAAPDVLDLDAVVADAASLATVVDDLAAAGFVPGPLRDTAAVVTDGQGWLVEADPGRPAEVRLRCQS